MTTLNRVLPDPARSHAVLIGVDQYHDKGLKSYAAPAEGARELAALFQDPEVWGLAEEHCAILTGAEDTTRDAILDAIEAAAKTAEDALVIYFSGHGVKWRDRFLMAHSSASKADCDRWLDWKLLCGRLDDRFTRVRHRIVILDSCQSATAISERTPEGDSAVLASCSSSERSWIPSGSRFSVYTGALIEVLAHGDARFGAAFSPDNLNQSITSRLSQDGLQQPDFQPRGSGAGLPPLPESVPEGCQPLSQFQHSVT